MNIFKKLTFDRYLGLYKNSKRTECFELKIIK